jgi:P4 family phage/plasmid primase-like protien
LLSVGSSTGEPPRVAAKFDPASVLEKRRAQDTRSLPLTAGDHKELAYWLLQALKDEGGRHDLISDEGELYEYLPWEGTWVAIPWHELSQLIQSFSASAVPRGKRNIPLKVDHMTVKGTIALAQDRVANPGFFANGSGGIAFKNGFLPITEFGVGELEKFQPHHRVRSTYPFDYDPTAKAPRFEAFLQDLFRDDVDKPEKIALIQEFFGAARAGISTRYQRCLFLRSNGGGGRSTLMKIIESAFSKDTMAGIKPQQFPDANRRAMLTGKLLNFADELPNATIMESDWFKQIVTGDWTDACLKYKNPIRFRPVAAHCFLANDLPPTSDLTDAFFRRVLIVAFNRKFHEEKTRDLTIADTIIETEMPGVVAFLLEGINRLVKSRRYTIPASHEEESRAWRTKSDTVALFLEEKTVHASSPVPGVGKDWMNAKALYVAYQEWGEATGHSRPVAQNVFGTRLKALGVYGRRTEKGIYYPIRLRRMADGSLADLLTDLSKRKGPKPAPDDDDE